jgi:hypothetical protein
MLKWLIEKALGCGPLAGIQVLRVSPGDVVVLRHSQRLSQASAARLKQTFEGALPEGVRVFVLNDGLTVDRLLRPSATTVLVSPNGPKPKVSCDA